VNPAIGANPAVVRSFDQVVSGYQHAGTGGAAFKERRLATVHFQRLFTDVTRWRATPLADRLDVREPVRAFACWAAVMTATAVDADYVVASRSKWGKHVAAREPAIKAEFYAQAASLGFDRLEVDKMWSKLAQIAVIAGRMVTDLDAASYVAAREEFAAAVTAARGHAPKTLRTPLFGLDAVMFHRGQGPAPAPRKPWMARSTHEIAWEQVHAVAPVLADTIHRYLDQLAVSLRPSSVAVIDITLRQLAGWIIVHRPDITTVAGIDRACIEGYKTWLAARPGYRGITTVSKTTIGMRMGHLRAFFTRIIEWDYPDAPARPPVFVSDRPLKDKPLPKFLDDAAAAAFMTAARNLPDPLDRLLVEVLARTGMRKGELLGLRVDAVVQIGSAYWLRTPIGKLHTDRYIPLHPVVKDLLDAWIADRPGWQASDLLLTHRGRAIPPSRVDKAVQDAATAAGIGHVHPHQLRHTLATQAINRGMSLEAIAALLGHQTMTMTMVYARIADRVVAEEYFAVTSKVQALYDKAEPVRLPATDEGTAMRHLRTEHQRMLGNGYCVRPEQVECHYDIICEGCTFFMTTIEFRPTLQAQRDDACIKGQHTRQAIFTSLLERLDNTGT
jgi:integrase